MLDITLEEEGEGKLPLTSVEPPFDKQTGEKGVFPEGEASDSLEDLLIILGIIVVQDDGDKEELLFLRSKEEGDDTDLSYSLSVGDVVFCLFGVDLDGDGKEGGKDGDENDGRRGIVCLLLRSLFERRRVSF